MIVRAPELIGHAGWIGVDGELSLGALRGRVVVLGFWTFSCAKCLRVLDDLRQIQERFPAEVTVVGVHSPKFPYAGEHDAVVGAVARHRFPFPILDDPELVTWQQYGVRGWPTVVVIDPRSNVVGALSGDSKGALLHQIVQDLVQEHRRTTNLQLQPVTLRPPRRSAGGPGGLSFPGKVATDRRGRLAIADTGNDRVLVAELGAGATARITHVVSGVDQPQGVRLYGSDLLICDTGGDRVVAVGLGGRPGPDEPVAADVAGILRLPVLASEVIARDLASPWDVVADADRSYVVTEAARQRLWRIPSDGSSPAVIAGDQYEGLVDGPADEAELAQPSGLARLPNGIAFVDAESSALRLLDGRGRIGTLVGEGLFDWGLRDGRAGTARMQHPQGIAASLDGTSLFIADTYNHRIRWWRDRRLLTLPIAGLAEPGGLDVLPDGRLVIADSGHHRIVLADPTTGEVWPVAFEHVVLPGAELGPMWGAPLSGATGEALAVPFAVDLGHFELDGGDGAPVRIDVSAEPPWLLDHGPTAWTHIRAEGQLRLQGGSHGSGTLTVTVLAKVGVEGVRSTRRSTTQHPLTVR